MAWHFHRWSKWEDFDVRDEHGGALSHPRYYVRRIVQTRRCSVCNLVKVRRSS